MGKIPEKVDTLIPYVFDVAPLNSEGRIIKWWRKKAINYVEKLDGGFELEMVEIPGRTFE